MSHDWRVYAQYVLETAAKLERISNRGPLSDEIVYDAVLRNLQTLSESTQHLPEDLKAQYPDIPWRAIAGFRNILVHNYLGDIIPATIEQILSDDLPDLVKTVKTMLAARQ